MLQLFKGTTELVGTAGALSATAHTVELANHIVDVLATHQLTDSLQVAVTASKEKDLLNDVVLIGRDVDEL